MNQFITRHISELIIHCAATPNGRPFTAKDIDRWHRERGFHRQKEAVAAFNPTLRYIGYHNVILTDGSVTDGRAWDEIGAHCVGHNAHSVGVCLIGTDQFTAAQWHTLKVYVEEFCRRFPEAGINGHRQFAAKLCPGFDVQAWLRYGMGPMEQHVIPGATP